MLKQLRPKYLPNHAAWGGKGKLSPERGESQSQWSWVYEALKRSQIDVARIPVRQKSNRLPQKWDQHAFCTYPTI